MYQKFEDVRKSFPWVRIDSQTHKILAIGTFEGLTKKGHIPGHLMTHDYYKQFILEKYGKTIEQFQGDSTMVPSENELHAKG